MSGWATSGYWLGVDCDAVPPPPPPPPTASPTMSAPPMTIPVIGPGRLYQGTAAFVFFFSAGSALAVAGPDAGALAGGGAGAAADGAAFAATAPSAGAAEGAEAWVNRTFNRVVPGVSMLIGGISCTPSFVTPSLAITPSSL